jgi:hypothetical protein
MTPSLPPSFELLLERLKAPGYRLSHPGRRVWEGVGFVPRRDGAGDINLPDPLAKSW